MANNKDSKGRFKPGHSGNKAGRPAGKRNALTDEKLAETFAKGDDYALKQIQQIMGNDKENGGTRLRAAASWVGFSLEMRKRIADEAKRAEKASESKPEQPEAQDETPIISFTAHAGGKKD